MLPQGFKNHPTLFGNVLTKELENWQGKNPSIALLQYIDDILLGEKTEHQYKIATMDLLNFLGLAGYQLSQKKPQIIQATVTYLRLEISQGKRKIGAERSEAMC